MPLSPIVISIKVKIVNLIRGVLLGVLRCALSSNQFSAFQLLLQDLYSRDQLRKAV